MHKETPENTAHALAEVIAIARRLLGEDGCPWDKQQTLETMTPYLTEEAHEVAEAIAHADTAHVTEELGDMLFLVIFLGELLEARDGVTLADVARANAAKLTRRHPHVFGDQRAESADIALRRWEELKAAEKGGAATDEPLGRYPKGLPALVAAYRTQQKAAAAGFDWRSPDDALAKVREEIGELGDAHASASPEAVAAEIGDALFALATYGRHAGVDAEQALHAAVRRFRTRYAHMQRALAARGDRVNTANDDALADAWRDAKISAARERSNSPPRETW